MRAQHRTQGSIAFFFFFSFFQSGQYDGPEFRQFCIACEDIRKRYPTLTVGALRTVCHVAALQTEGPVGYEEITALSDLTPGNLAHQIQQLSDGRGDQRGLGLLQRCQNDNRRSGSVELSPAGLEISKLFPPPDRPVDLPAYMRERVAPALSHVMERRRFLSLGSLSVLLYLVRHQEEFGYDGVSPQRIVADLGISNLPRHFATLSKETGEREEPPLVRFETSPKDKRIKIPELTTEGHALISLMAATMAGEAVETPKRPKPEALEALPNREDVSSLSPEDYEELDWAPGPSSDGAPPATGADTPRKPR